MRQRGPFLAYSGSAPTPPGIDPAELRQAGAALHEQVETLAAELADGRAAMAQAGAGWPGKAGQALREALPRMADRDRELVAMGRDLAHHMLKAAGPVETTEGETDWSAENRSSSCGSGTVTDV